MQQQIKYGDILTTTGIIVHQVNCRGVMGSGIAKQIKQQYPAVFEVYRNCFERGDLRLGVIQAVYVDWNKVIVNACAQEDYGTSKRQTNYTALRDCFKQIAEMANSKTINYPKIGCGLGGGDWTVVSKIIDEELG